jgi:late competence protein required for DNA uptake (superfamily II DNA/RNA helicase)
MKKSKKIKREEAAKRQKVYNKLSYERKVALIQSRRGGSQKEYEKILDKNIFCNVCGESKNTVEIGIIYGQHTCRNCAVEMGENLSEVGLQHI